MEIVRDKAAMRSWSRAQRAAGQSIAFVPTMGSLHDGHLSLVEAAAREADVVVASVYVNPTQFAPGEDFDAYPRDESSDFAALEALGCAAVFAPSTLYDGDGADVQRTWIEISDLTDSMCGASRPHFFRGVATVVSKLFHIVEPDVAIFGDKDYQQRRVVERMVEELDMAVRIVGMPIVREADGLAMSSRNVRLTPEDRRRARAVPESLELAARLADAGERDVSAIQGAMIEHIEASGGRVDYALLVDEGNLAPLKVLDGPARASVAVHFGDVRLIDNRAIGG